MKVIGLVGQKGGGKGTFVNYLKEGSSFLYIIEVLKFSDLLFELLDLISLPSTRENLQKAAQMIDEKFGEGTFANAIYQRVSGLDADIVILDGVRWPADEKLVRRFDDNVMVYITADPDTRFNRLKARNEKEGEGEMTRDQFDREEEAPNELHISEIGSRAEFPISNNGSIEELEDQVADFHNRFLI